MSSKKDHLSLSVCLFLLFLLTALCFSIIPEDNSSSLNNIRAPAVAGQFYSDNANLLRNGLAAFFSDAIAPSGSKPVAIIAPHAGYIYSGQIAADAYNQARSYRYDLIILLGTNHTTAGFAGISVYRGRGYRTPLGIAEIDVALADALIKTDANIEFYPPVHTTEHSVEVQVPFVQYLFPDSKILPVVIGAPNLQMCTRFGEILADHIKDRQALIVASSDFSHYPVREQATEVDLKTLEVICSMQPTAVKNIMSAQIQRGIVNLSTCACGQAPILAAITAAKQLGATCAAIISYANSGQTAMGSRERVVGYGAVTFSDTEPCKPESNHLNPDDSYGPAVPLQNQDKKELLQFARKVISQYLDSRTTPLARNFSPALYRQQGVFVTLEHEGQLRGCIGHLEDDTALCEITGAMALHAAFGDRRFRPLTQEELPGIEIEISLLSPFKPIANVKEIQVGRDGVYLLKDNYRAVLLPQVAVENNWDRYLFLEHLCLKAGLPREAWRGDVELFTFQAERIKESEY